MSDSKGLGHNISLEYLCLKLGENFTESDEILGVHKGTTKKYLRNYGLSDDEKEYSYKYGFRLGKTANMHLFNDADSDLSWDRGIYTDPDYVKSHTIKVNDIPDTFSYETTNDYKDFVTESRKKLAKALKLNDSISVWDAANDFFDNKTDKETKKIEDEPTLKTFRPRKTEESLELKLKSLNIKGIVKGNKKLDLGIVLQDQRLMGALQSLNIESLDRVHVLSLLNAFGYNEEGYLDSIDTVYETIDDYIKETNLKEKAKKKRELKEKKKKQEKHHKEVLKIDRTMRKHRKTYGISNNDYRNNVEYTTMKRYVKRLDKLNRNSKGLTESDILNKKLSSILKPNETVEQAKYRLRLIEDQLELNLQARNYARYKSNKEVLDYNKTHREQRVELSLGYFEEKYGPTTFNKYLKELSIGKDRIYPYIKDKL